LQGLSSIKILDLGGNQFSNFDTKVIDELDLLEALILSDNQLTSYPDIPFDEFKKLAIALNRNRLKALPTEYSTTIDPDYNILYLAENCIDRTDEEELLYGNILDSRDNTIGFPEKRRDQYLCANISYAPSQISGSTAGNVLASVIFNGPIGRKTDFFTANPGLTTEHTFTNNGSYVFDYSSTIGQDVFIDPVDGILTATVTRIDKEMPEVINTIYVPSGIPG
jgi:hypothetical protein